MAGVQCSKCCAWLRAVVPINAAVGFLDRPQLLISSSFVTPNIADGDALADMKSRENAGNHDETVSRSNMATYAEWLLTVDV